MRRLWIFALLALSCFCLNGCGGSKDSQSADASSSSSTTSNDSSRPKRDGGASSSSPSQSSSSGDQMSGDPRMNSGADSGTGAGDQMSGDPRMSQGGGNDSGEPEKPDNISQENWDKMTPRARRNHMEMASGGGGYQPGKSSSGGGSGDGNSAGGQMTGDPRMNGGGRGEDADAGGQMSGDPRMNGGGRGEDADAGGQMNGDPRMNGGGRGEDSGAGGQMSGDPRMNGGGGSGGGGAGAGMAPGAGAGMAPGSGGGSSGSGSSFGSANSGAKRKTPVTLMEKGIAAFQNGDDDGGFQYLYGHYIAESKGRKNIPLKFLATAKRPRTEIRWGVGVVYTKSKGFEGDPPLIGEKPNVESSSGGRRSGGRSSGTTRPGPSAGGGGGGSPGSSGGGAGGAGGSGGDGTGFGSGSGSSGSGMGSSSQRNTGKPSDGGISELSFYTGEVGDSLLEWLEKIRKNGNNGDALAKVDFGGGGGSGGQNNSSGGSSGMQSSGSMMSDTGDSGSNTSAKDSATSSLKNLLPGVIMLGKSEKRDALVARAKAHAVDILALVEVRAKFVPKTGQKVNETKVSLYDVSGPEMVKVGRPSTMLQNVKVWQQLEKSKDRDPISDSISKIFESAAVKVANNETKTIAQVYKLAEMPKVDGEIVMNRLKSLVAEGLKSGNPMRGLVELTYYREKGLLPEKAYTDAVNKITNSEIGDVLLNGSEKERIEAIAPFLPPQWKVPEPVEGADEKKDEFL